MITHEQAAEMFKGQTIEAIPSDMKRIVIPAYGFAGAKDAKRQEWVGNAPVMEDVKGLTFKNPKDNADQVLKQADGVLLCFDAPGRKEKIEAYLKENPKTFMTANTLQKFIDYLKNEVVNEGGKADLWDSDVNFAAGLKDAPAKEDIKPGKIFSAVKNREVVQAVFVNEGVEFEGAEGKPQTAGKGGAYILNDGAGMRMIQKAEFNKAYSITKIPNQDIKDNSKEM